MVALGFEVGLSLLVVLDTSSGTAGLVGVGAAVALVLLVVSLASGWDAALYASLGVLGLMPLAGADDRLILAPLYGAGLLAVTELARTVHELRRLGGVGPGVIAARLTIGAASAGLGGCAAALVAVGVTVGPPRSVSLSVAATLAVGVAYGAIVAMARRTEPPDADSEAAHAPHQRSDDPDAPMG